MSNRTYIAIDLKSFYASVECVERGLDPLNTNLVVADESRTEKTICLAVSPSLKSHGISGRARLFEVVSRVREVNNIRRKKVPGGRFTGKSYIDSELKEDIGLELDYIIAPPRMAHYIDYSTRVYNTYLKYVSSEDIHVYSIDEVFIDVTTYLNFYQLTAHELAMTIIRDVLKTTGVTATAGIGTNMYLAKIAMDIVAKHIEPDEDGVRIAEIDEQSYRRLLWGHRPITDFWRVGKGYANKLADNGIFTMGDVARCSLGKPDEYYNEDLLYRLFGINAELLIDHAWGYEPCTIADIRAYKPSTKSVSQGQVLTCPYTNEKARLVLHEMVDLMVLDLVDNNFTTDQIVLTVGYDIDNLTDPIISRVYHGPIETDGYGRKVPKKAHKSTNLGKFTSSSKLIIDKTLALFDEITDSNLLIRRLTISANHLTKEQTYEQMTLFSENDAEAEAFFEREKTVQKTVLDIKKKYGKNAVLKGINLVEGATAMDRNNQIGGHRK